MIIDGHRHIVDEYEPILAEMDALGIQRTVLVGVGVRDLRRVTIQDSFVFRSHLLLRTLGMLKARALMRSAEFQENLLGVPRNDAVLRAMAARPDRFDGFVFVNPESPESMAMVEGCLDAGMKGLKLALVQYPTDLSGVRMAALCEIAQARQVPIFIHIGLDRSTTDLSSVVRNFPSVTFIAAHAGCQRFRQIMDLAKRSMNLMIDTSSHMATPGKLLWLWKTLGAEKLIFGSDCPVMCSDLRGALAKILDLPIPATDKEKILGGNLASLLGAVRSQ